MRTLLISLAFVVLVSGCATMVPRGMENTGGVSDLSASCGNGTQGIELHTEDADRAARAAIWIVDALTK